MPFLTARWEHLVLLFGSTFGGPLPITGAPSPSFVSSSLAALSRPSLVYNEPYVALAMRHHSSLTADEGGEVRYEWSHKGIEFELGARVSGPAAPLSLGSEAEFITEHYWGYPRQRDGGTLEYQLEDTPWCVWTATDSCCGGPRPGSVDPFGALLAATPKSAFVAVGSPVAVHRGRRL